MSDFSVCNTRWSCDHAAGISHAVLHAAVAAFTNSICMLNTRNTAGWSDCQPPMHNDFAACIWLFFSLQHITEEQTCGQSEGREKRKHLELLILCVKCVCVCFFFGLQGNQKARGVLCPVAESYCSLKQRDCGGIHLMLLIVWQSTPLI